MIKIKGEKLCQYDLNRQVELIPRGGATMKSVTFERGGVSLVTAIKEQDGVTVADIPNILLKAFGCMTVRYEGFGDDGHEIEEKVNLYVNKREKPADYVYEETETLGLCSVQEIVQMVLAELGESGGGINPPAFTVTLGEDGVARVTGGEFSEVNYWLYDASGMEVTNVFAWDDSCDFSASITFAEGFTYYVKAEVILAGGESAGFFESALVAFT